LWEVGEEEKEERKGGYRGALRSSKSEWSRKMREIVSQSRQQCEE
jgi:hypothetical protein